MSSKQRSTPGPWIINPEFEVEDYPFPGCKKQVLHIFSSDRHIYKSLVCSIEGPQTRRYKDAALIAALPEMRDVLIEILDNAVVNGVYREKAEKILKKAGVR